MLLVLRVSKAIEAKTGQKKCNFSVRRAVFQFLSLLEGTLFALAIKDFYNLCRRLRMEPLFTKKYLSHFRIFSFYPCECNPVTISEI